MSIESRRIGAYSSKAVLVNSVKKYYGELASQKMDRVLHESQYIIIKHPESYQTYVVHDQDFSVVGFIKFIHQEKNSVCHGPWKFYVS